MHPLAHYTVYQDGQRFLHGPLYTPQTRFGIDPTADVRLGTHAFFTIGLEPLSVTAHTEDVWLRDEELPLRCALSFKEEDRIEFEDGLALSITPKKHTTVPLARSAGDPIDSVLMHEGTRVPLPTDAPFIIGSGKTCSLHLDDPSVSVIHATIGWLTDRWYLQDQSRNGTFVGGLHLRGGLLELRPGTTIELGSGHQLSFQLAQEPPPLVARSKAMQKLLTDLQRVARTDYPVVLLGPSGAGKSEIARWIHAHSPRAHRPFRSYNAAAITPSLYASELFGHRAGAFTGADQDRTGAFVAAQGGTLFLDEIADLDPAVQASLLVVLQEQHIRPVGDDASVPVDVRLITATNQDLGQAIQDGRCRHDFVARLGLTFEVPSLRRRAEDIVPLALMRMRDSDGPAGLHFTPEAEDRLIAHSWPGNIRELFQVVDRLSALRHGHRLTADMVETSIQQQTRLFNGEAFETRTERVRLRPSELGEYLAATRGNLSQAARRAGVADSTFRRWVQNSGLDPKTFR